MNISFYLKRPGAETSPIYVAVTHRGKAYRKATGLTARTSQWSRGRSTNKGIQSALRPIRLGLEYELDETSDEKAILGALERVSEGRWNDVPQTSFDAAETAHTPTFYEHFKEWSERDSGAKRQKQLAYRKVLELMGKAWDWDSLGMPFYIQLLHKLQDEGCSVNYQGAIISRCKTAVSEAYKLGYHHNDSFRSWAKPSEKVASIYLTEAEAEKIMSYEAKLLEWRKAIALFTLGYKSGARYSDFSRFSLDNVKDGRLVWHQQKTSQLVIIPCSPRIVSVLEQWGGTAPFMPSQKFNEIIKKVAKAAGLTDMVEVVHSEGVRHIHESKPRYELISSHTCRRSCLTNLYLSGVSAKECMVISGHTSLAAFEKYLKMTNEVLVDKLAKNEFFL